MDSLSGLKVVVDGANGAASQVAPLTYREAGAEVIAIHCAPDGYNINRDCGSTHLGDLQKAVVKHGADLGIGHDGDADRCLAVDASGALVDGDQLMAIIALAMRDAGRLAHDTVVATVMANLGFKQAMQRESISVVEDGGCGGPVRAGGHARLGLRARGRAERPCRDDRACHHRRRLADRPAGDEPHGRYKEPRWRSWPV